jgi:hypothetical protein
VALLAVLTFWAVGALPWIARGAQLPVPESWLADGGRLEPRAPLPFAPGTLALLAVLTSVGGVAAVLVSLAGRVQPGGTRRPVHAAFLGGALAAAVAIGLSAVTAARSLQPGTASELLVVGLTIAAGLASLLGLVAGAAIVSGPPWLRMLTLAAVAALMPSWILSVVISDARTATSSWVLAMSPWLAGGLLGGAVAAFGVRPARRALMWPLAFAVAWVVPPALTGLVYLSSLLRPAGRSEGLSELVSAAVQVVGLALDPGHQRMGPYVLALVLGLAGSILRLRSPSAREGAPAPGLAPRHTEPG